MAVLILRTLLCFQVGLVASWDMEVSVSTSLRRLEPGVSGHFLSLAEPGLLFLSEVREPCP